MQIIAQAGTDDLAKVYIAKTTQGKLIEFVESLQPPFSREEKWVFIISVSYGCVVGCAMCDAGGWYQGKLSKDDLLAQIDYMIEKRFPDRSVPIKKFKIQFARMGEPSLNSAVLEVLRELPSLYRAPGLMPSISTVAPAGAEKFFAELFEIKNQHYAEGNFQMQFSIHTTDVAQRDKIIPVKKWNFAQIAAFGEKFFSRGDRKITLNFAVAKDFVVDPLVLKQFFDPRKFMLKITPINPTLNAQNNKLENSIDANVLENNDALIKPLEDAGYDVLLSIGELEENKIGSNCGQYIKRFLDCKTQIADSYEYALEYFD